MGRAARANRCSPDSGLSEEALAIARMRRLAGQVKIESPYQGVLVSLRGGSQTSVFKSAEHKCVNRTAAPSQVFDRGNRSVLRWLESPVLCVVAT